MCTISFIPGRDGFLLGMNRDELRSRPIALPPELHETSEGFAVYPSEPGGGTWIGMNDAGLCLTLINWHKIPVRRIDRAESRGIVIRELIQSNAGEDLSRFLHALPIEGMPPFRLIAINSREKVIAEFQWDQSRVVTMRHGWIPGHWFSSGLDEKRVETERGAVCRRAWSQPGAGEICWLRRLHGSHLASCRWLSICMHGLDAHTVSYTETQFCGATATMRYHPGPLCNGESQFLEKTLELPTRTGLKR